MPRTDSMVMKVVVDDVHREADGIVTLTLVDGVGSSLPAWDPGAHIDVHLTDQVTRQYSLHSDPKDLSSYRISVLREPKGRGGSQYVHDKIARGDVLAVSMPRNHFRLKAAEQYVFIAGGIGITPLLPMTAHAERHNTPFRLHYAGRSRSKMAFVQLLSTSPSVAIYVSDERSRLDIEEAIEVARDSTVQIYCCGPDRLVETVVKHCDDMNISQRLHIERFSAVPVELDLSVEAPFEVELARSGKVLQVSADQTILDAVSDTGIKAPSSCAEGICGSCEVTVLHGEVDHRDHVLDDEEKAASEVMMICCSRARSKRLVIDL